jgi:hypothetical protein
MEMIVKSVLVIYIIHSGNFNFELSEFINAHGHIKIITMITLLSSAKTSFLCRLEVFWAIF